MQALLIFLLFLTTCKQVSTPMTEDSEVQGYRNFTRIYDDHTYFVNKEIDVLFNNGQIFDQEKNLAKTLSKNDIFKDSAEKIYTEKILHKIRSMIAYAYYSRCFVRKRTPGKLPHDDPINRISDWRQRYNLNQVDRQRFCSLFLIKMKDMLPGFIDLKKPNHEFFQAVLDNKIQSPTATVSETADLQRKLSKTLQERIISVTENSMASHHKNFPFVTSGFRSICEQEKHKNCNKFDVSQLRQLSPYREHIPSVSSDPAQSQVFGNVNLVTDQINNIIGDLNSYRQTLNKLATAGATEKKPFILPFLKLLNEIDLKEYDVVVAWEAYRKVLIDRAKEGLLPLVFSDKLQKKIGKIHLNQRGKFFGFGGVSFPLLKDTDTKTVGEVTVELRKQLLSSWS